MANLIKGVDLKEYAFIGMQESQYLLEAAEFEDQVMARADGTDEAKGDRLPWEHMSQISFRPGEVSLWAGYNHHGKSLVAGMVAGWWMPGVRQVIASFEMPAAATLDRMAAQCAGNLEYTRHWLRSEFMKASNEHLWLYDVQERTEAERVLGLLVYSAKELNVDHVWIDSLMQCGMPGDTREAYAKQALFIDDLCRISKYLGIHTHLIHHLRKPMNTKAEEQFPSRYEARGAGEISDRVDNVLLVHKNMRKLHKIESGNTDDETEEMCDGWIIIDKQRHKRGPGGTGRGRFYFHESGQWTRKQGHRMQWYSGAQMRL